ncbi:MAG: dihydropyrimidinase, partial [Planctomycetes bacterium]|nr:dihydropyrimidinase [Planctomycetota bacterium]
MSRLLIRNAFVATGADVTVGDVLAVDGRIAAVGPDLTAEDAAVVEARGKYLLPGGVDPHTHFDLDAGSARAADDFLSGSSAAAAGGTTTIINHPAFGPPGCGLFHQQDAYHQLARDCVVDYGFHGVVQRLGPDVLADMQRLRDREGVSSVKVYLTYDCRLPDRELFEVLCRARELGLTVCAHCENDGVIAALRDRYLAAGDNAPRFHARSRPPLAEAEAVQRFLALAAMAGDAPAYVVHLSTRLGLEAVRAARRGGQQNVWAETCPQYLLLDESLYDDDQEGLKYIMSPPLRSREDREALWDGLTGGDIDTVGSDHCPFLFSGAKQLGAESFARCPGGIPGVELRLALLFSEGFRRGRMDLPAVVRACCRRPAELFGLAPAKGDIRVGAAAERVLFDPADGWTVDQT